MSDETSDLGDVCDWCGEEIKQPPTGRRRDYCSRTHREYAYRARRERRLMEGAAATALETVGWPG